MFAALARDFRRAPLTFSLLAASVALFLVVELYQTSQDGAMMGRRAFGAVDELVIRGEPELHGPFDLWDGPWWRWVRVPLSAFHHANLLHLFFNVTTIWFLGPLLERRMLGWVYLAFWWLAATVSLLPEFYLGHVPVGLSGVACAMFGWCLVERHFDSLTANRVQEGVVQSFWAFLFLCVGLTAVDVINIANVAHFTGVAYGWLIARARHSRRTLFWSVVAGHALLPAAVFGVLHPVWNGRYHALLGLHKKDQARNLRAGVPDFREAVRWEPELPGIWVRLAAERALDGDQLGAWRDLIDGLQHNRSNDELANHAQRTWRFLAASDREAAREWLDRRFGNEAPAWSKRLQLSAEPFSEATLRESDDSEFDLAAEIKKLFHQNSAESPPRGDRKKDSPGLDPSDPDSAAEGRAL